MFKRFLCGAAMVGLLVPCGASAAGKGDAAFTKMAGVQAVRLADEEYVKTLYRELLGREADPEGLAGYVNELRMRRLTRLGVRKDIVKSPEYRERMLKAFQNGGGNAVADTRRPGMPVVLPPGTPGFPGVPAAPGGTVTKDGKPVSAEDDNKAYVTWLYRSVFRRNPDAGGLQGHLEQLTAGNVTREGLLRRFLDSDEYKNRTGKGEIPAFDPTKAGDYRTTLDDLFGGWTQTGGPSDETGAKAPEEFALEEKDKGAIEFQTKGITHMEDDPKHPGDYWFFVMEGDYGQIRLQHTAGTTEGGTKRAVRYYLKFRPKFGEGKLGIEVASDNLPDWHTWRVEWEPGRIAFFLDGNSIGEEKGYTIKPKRVMIGGYVGGGRNFKGTWRNYRAR